MKPFGFTKDDETTPLSVIENTERSAILIAMRNQKNNVSPPQPGNWGSAAAPCITN